MKMMWQNEMNIDIIMMMDVSLVPLLIFRKLIE